LVRNHPAEHCQFAAMFPMCVYRQRILRIDRTSH
jgi:hypothetical protein